MKKCYKDLMIEVLCTFMADVCATMNLRPLAILDTDAKWPTGFDPESPFDANAK